MKSLEHNMALSVLIGLLFTIVSGDQSVRNITICGTQTYQPHTPQIHISTTTRIVGGREAVPHSWPWMVVLRFRTSTLTCGGSIIRTSSGELVILTAAQCVDGTNAADWHVDTGVHSREAHEENQKTYTVSAIIRHEDFNPFYIENDIAILRVSPAIVENDYTRPICVTNIPSSAFWGKQCVVTGWGATVEGGLPADKLKEVYKPVLSDATCLSNVGGAYNVDHMVCAGYLEGGKGACAGDNGGPLACKNDDGQYDLIGIVSWGFGCARQGLPAVYANVHKYLDWIGNKTMTN